MIEPRMEELACLYVVGALTPAELLEFEGALKHDPELPPLVARLRAVRDALAGAVPPAELPPQVKQRLLAQLDSRNKKAAPVPAPAVRQKDSSDFLGFWFPWSLTAVAVFLGMNWYLDKGDLKVQLRHQTARIEELDKLAATLRSATNSLQQSVATLNAASKVDEVRIALLSSPLTDFPKPVAVSLWDNQQQSGVLVAQNLKSLAPDRDYQLWIVDPQYTTPVSAGVFQTDLQGYAHIHFKADKTIGKPNRFTVTSEVKGGAATPTFRNMVLVGG